MGVYLDNTNKFLKYWRGNTRIWRHKPYAVTSSKDVADIPDSYYISVFSKLKNDILDVVIPTWLRIPHTTGILTMHPTRLHMGKSWDRTRLLRIVRYLERRRDHVSTKNRA